jgi:NAD(P)-dependent dehydrogenase (short-subunit alcohol dehydrogenase family)
MPDAGTPDAGTPDAGTADSSTGAKPLAGKNAIVTGGAAGIGRAISERLARDGARVAIFDVNAEGAAQLAGQLEWAVAHTVDVSDRSSVERAVTATREQLGPVTVLVNNAGIDCIEPFTSLDVATWERIFAVNMTGTFHCTQLVVSDMIEAGWGRIVNISSSSAQRGSRGMSAYSASKGAMISFTRSLALELGPHGITVNNIPPGFIETPMLHKQLDEGRFPPGFMDTQIQQTPVGRAGQPEDIAAACAFLASPDAGYITGQTFGVNGGRLP